ncbi:MAG: protein-L-isoaspartate(D-aspartate) O-methyltransferase [Gammaproteobacteria bacterium]|nr:protein-L-isoaspartate(D-aspartate) O-methyltransferase [Gammaproteobacteria bacterium]
MDKNLNRMLADIESEVKYTRAFIGKNKLDDHVMDAMAKVPRDTFVPKPVKYLAFDNGPLPIGHGQTISQPYIVALMTDLLELKPEHSVLEIGTGSGYQTAILSVLCKQVYSMERIPELYRAAREHFKELGYNNIESCVGNGYEGWPEHAPYDGIIVTASASHIPEPLMDQLKPGGNLVIPVGLPPMHQELLLVKKDLQDKLTVDSILGVAFVPLIDDSIPPPSETRH